jgi:TolB-like protein
MGEGASKPTSAPTGAVFLSYASQDAEAAQRIATALRASGIEVWFDQSELRGGDAWDQKIRRELRDCTLFMPVISANTAARHEGYFRLEWDIADQRTHMIAHNRAFIVPVCVDGTSETGGDTPESFRRVQWTRLPIGEATPDFVSRIAGLVGSQASGTGRDISSASLATPSIERRPLPARAWIWSLVAVLVVATLGVWPFWTHVNVPSRATPPAVGAKSLAVLPFVDMSEKHDQEYFSDGLSEELIDRLAHSPNLKVIARTSSFAFKGKNDDIRIIAARLGVANLLEGSVRRSDNQLRITAQLIRGRDGAHVWSESFDRNVANIFQVQEEIAATVAASLQTALSAREADASIEISPDAYVAFLQGKYFFQRDGKGDLDRSVAAYRDAIRLQRNYALAWVGLGRTLNFMGLSGSLNPSEAYKRAREAVDRALEINPDLAEAHRVLGILLVNYEFDFRGYKREIDRAVELDPHVDLGNSPMMDAIAAGHTADAVLEGKRLIDRDPLTSQNYYLFSYALYQNSQLEEAETAVNKARELSPTREGYFSWLAVIAMARNEPTKALELLGHETNDASKQSATIDALWMLGRRGESDHMLHVFEERYGDSAAFDIAESYLLRGDRDAAFRWLDRAYQNREPRLGMIRGMREFRDLHDDPRYKALSRQLNLPE